MIHEMRTYDLKPRTVDIMGDRLREMLDGRLEYSPLGGFWYTEMGPLNQIVHIWPYDDANHRADVRSRAVADGAWPPNSSDIMVNMNSEVLIPAPFMPPLEPRKVGPIFELRIYTYGVGDIPKVLEAWSDAIEERQKYSPLVGCWYSEIGNLNRFMHMWAYESFEERGKIRAETRQKGIWPPPGNTATPIAQENKILLPYDFSPLQ
jgi:hypothetical protein